MMTIELESMAVAMPEVEGHPNRAAFSGSIDGGGCAVAAGAVGSKGHRVVLTRRRRRRRCLRCWGWRWIIRRRLTGMMRRRKVGVITSADIVGRNLELGGYLFARDFPEIVGDCMAKGSVEERNSRGFGFRPGADNEFSEPNEGENLRASLGMAVEEVRQ